MPFSIWEYLRQRTRDSVLAGIQDAMDIAEQGDTNGSQHDQANRLTSNLGGSLNGTSEAKQLPHAIVDGFAKEAVAEPSTASPSPEAPQRPTDEAAFDDEFESRLNATASQNGHQAPSAANDPGRRRRGRPPKQGGSKP